jgi:hypothetical protein
MTEKHSQYGKIKLFNDFTGEEIYLPAVDHANALGALWNIGGGFTIKGYALSDSVCGVAAVSEGLNGQILLTTSDNADADAMYVTTEVCLKPSVNGTMVLETRLEMAALTTRAIFVGFVGTMADAESDILTGSGTTLTLSAETDLCGFFFDSQLTTDVEWHMVHNGGTTTGVTDSTLLNSGVAPVANEMNILRVEIDNNGTARWLIDGVLLKTLEGAVDPAEVFAACVGAANTATTSVTMAIDYIAVEANRDWTI